MKLTGSAVWFQEIDYAGFKIFMDIFLEVATPEDLCKHLFLSFVRIPQPANFDGKTLKVSLILFTNYLTQIFMKPRLTRHVGPVNRVSYNRRVLPNSLYTKASKLTNFGRSDSRQFGISSVWKLFRSKTHMYWKRQFSYPKHENMKVEQPI